MSRAESPDRGIELHEDFFAQPRSARAPGAEQPPRLVLRFAVYTGCVLLVAGLAMLYVLGGSFRGRLAAVVDGREIGSSVHRLDYEGQYVSLGEVTLEGGAHTVELRQTSPWLRPGTGGPAWALGPLVLAPAGRCGTAA